MNVEWDYTKLAKAYLKRPDYADNAIEAVFSFANFKNSDGKKLICDVGAGVAHLTLALLKHSRGGGAVAAVEPNEEMRKLGIERTAAFKNVKWFEGVGENTGQPSDTFDLVTFGSSFNTTNRQEALKETYRILKPQGCFACLWNHRDLSDAIQKEIENIIKTYVIDYDYGTRREDQTEIIKSSGLFEDIQPFSGSVVHSVSINDVIEGWRSHATLFRQAGDKFSVIIEEIEKFLKSLNKESIKVPYETHGWMARSKKV